MIGLPEAAESDTVNVAVVVPASPSAVDTLLMPTVGAASLSTIVPTPWLSAMVAFAGFERFARNVSSNSSDVSPTTGTVNVRVTTPGLNVSVPTDSP